MALITYLVEDNEIVLENLMEALQEIACVQVTGHGATQAEQEIACVQVTGHGATQAEASQWLSSHDGEWHLAIVDLFLKEGNGLGVLAGCRKREPYQKVVVLTNYATEEIRRRAADLGADAVFDKSSELDDLFAYCAEQTSHEAEPENRQAQHAALLRLRGMAAAPAPRGTPSRG